MLDLLQRMSVRTYRIFLRAYPCSYRRQLGPPMEEAFAELCAERLTGLGAALRIWIREYPSLLLRGVSERLSPDRRPYGKRPSKRKLMNNDASWLGSVLQDVTHGLRMLRCRPAFATVIIVTLTLGIGMNTAIFSVLHGVLLQPLPFPEPERLVRFGRTSPGDGTWLNPLSPLEFRDMAARIKSLESMVAATPVAAVLTDMAEPAQASGTLTTVGLFDTFGMSPQLGRSFLESDSDPGAASVVVLSHGFWRARLGGRLDVLGTTVELDGTPHSVVGVAPEGFGLRPTVGLNDAEYWVPLRWTEDVLTDRHSHFVMPYGRMASGASPDEVNRELATLWPDYIKDDPGNHLDTSYETGLHASPLHEFVVGGSRQPLMFLAGAVALVLAVACVNVVNLLLANADTRRHELAVRAALGAGRGRLVRQFLTEAVVVAAIGGVLGIVVAAATVEAIVGLFPDAMPRATEVGVDGPVLAFAAAVSLITALVLGLVSALQAELGASALRARSGGRSAASTRLRQATVVAEIALALILVIGASLLLKSFWNAQQVDLGFEPEGLMVVNLTLPADQYQEPEARAQFYDALLQSLDEAPAIESAALSSMVPVRDFGTNVSGLTAVGNPDRRAQYVERRQITPGYHATLGVQILRGRDFTRADSDAAPTLIINQTLSRVLFDDADPIGRRLLLGPDDETPREIIGMVADIRAGGAERRVRPHMYAPTRAAGNLLVRARADPSALLSELRAIVRETEPTARVYQAQTYGTLIAESLGERQFVMFLIGAFGLVALALGAVGTYGVMLYAVEGRMRDFGIRLAVGARALDIRLQVLRSAGALAGIGLGAGLLGAYGLRTLVASLLYDVDAADPLVYAVVGLVTGGIAALACWIPANRAASADPIETLRFE